MKNKLTGLFCLSDPLSKTFVPYRPDNRGSTVLAKEHSTIATCAMAVFLVVITTYANQNLPDSCHSNESPPESFPSSGNKRTRKFIWVFNSILVLKKQTISKWSTKSSKLIAVFKKVTFYSKRQNNNNNIIIMMMMMMIDFYIALNLEALSALQLNTVVLTVEGLR